MPGSGLLIIPNILCSSTTLAGVEQKVYLSTITLTLENLSINTTVGISVDTLGVYYPKWMDNIGVKLSAKQKSLVTMYDLSDTIYLPITDVDSQNRLTVTFTTALYPTQEGITEINEAIDIDITYAVSIEDKKATIAKTATIELDVGDTISYDCSYYDGKWFVGENPFAVEYNYSESGAPVSAKIMGPNLSYSHWGDQTKTILVIPNNVVVEDLNITIPVVEIADGAFNYVEGETDYLKTID